MIILQSALAYETTQIIEILRIINNKKLWGHSSQVSENSQAIHNGPLLNVAAKNLPLRMIKSKRPLEDWAYVINCDINSVIQQYETEIRSNGSDKHKSKYYKFRINEHTESVINTLRLSFSEAMGINVYKKYIINLILKNELLQKTLTIPDERSKS